MPRTRRIVAGVSASPGNLPALRHAADLARVYDAALTFVHAWLPSGPEFAAWQFPSGPLVLQWQDDAWRRMWHALDTAFGGLPPDLEAEPLVMRGNPGPVLVGAASRDGDTLVVGAGRRGTFGRLRHGRVSRYCLAHAGCPVIAVPSPVLDRAAVRAARGRDARVPDLTTAGRPPGALVPIPWLTTGGCHGRAAIWRGQRVGTTRAGMAGSRAPDRGRRDRRAADPGSLLGGRVRPAAGAVHRPGLRGRGDHPPPGGHDRAL